MDRYIRAFKRAKLVIKFFPSIIFSILCYFYAPPPEDYFSHVFS